MIEASKVDLGSHDNNATYLVGEMIEADRLIRQLMHYIDTHPEQNL
jgi:alkaline phosphatase